MLDWWVSTLSVSNQVKAVFQATSALDRGQLKSKGNGKLSIHICADEATIESIFRTIISVNQLSIFRAVADLCEEPGHPLIDSEQTYIVLEQSESMVAPIDLFDIKKISDG